MFDEDEEITSQEQKKNTNAIRDQAINYFCKLWTVDQLKELIDSGIFARPYCVELIQYFANVKRKELTNQQWQKKGYIEFIFLDMAKHISTEIINLLDGRILN